MAKIAKHTIKWNPVSDAGLAGYRVYVKYGETADPYEGTMIETMDTEAVVPDDFPAGTFDQEGTYVIQVSAFDSQGNESDTVVISHPFDFTPPPAPTGLHVV